MQSNKAMQTDQQLRAAPLTATPLDGREMVTVRPVESLDAANWLEMRMALWPADSDTEHREEIDQFLAGEFPRRPWSVLLAEDAAGRALGFAEVSVRPYAEGCPWCTRIR